MIALARLGWRLARGARRVGVATLLTGLASIVATTVLIASLVAPNVLDARQRRDEARQPRAVDQDQTTGATATRYSANLVRLAGKTVRLVEIARADGGPTPPGVSHDAHGWVVSPELAEWAARTPLAALAFPFAATAPRITRDGLEDPGELLAYSVIPLHDASGNAYPIGGFGSVLPERGGVASTRELTAMLFVGLPLTAVLWAAARLSSQRKDARMQALRMLGLSRTRVAFVGAIEISLIVAIGAVVAAITVAVAVPHLSRFMINGTRLDPADVHLLPAIPIAITLVTLFATCVATGCLWNRLRGTRHTTHTRRSTRTTSAVATAILVVAAVAVAVVGRPNPTNADRSMSLLGPLIPLLGVAMALALPTLIRLTATAAMATRSLGASTVTALARIRTETETATRPTRMLSVGTFVLVVTLVVLTAFSVDLSWSNPHRRPDNLALLRVSGNSPTLIWTPASTMTMAVVPVFRTPDNHELVVASCAELTLINVGPLDGCDTSPRRLTIPEFGDPITDYPSDLPLLHLTTANEMSFSGMVRVDPTAIPATLIGQEPTHYFALIPRTGIDEFTAIETARNPWIMIQFSSIDLIDVAPDSGGRWIVTGAFVALFLGVVGSGITAIEQAYAARPSDRRFLILGASRRQRRARTAVEVLTPLLPGSLLGAGCGLLAGAAYRNVAKNGSLVYPQLLLACTAASVLAALLALAALPAAHTTHLESLSTD